MKRSFVIVAVLAVGLSLVGSAMPAIAQSGNTWQADYFNNPDWAGPPVAAQWVSLVSFDWGYGSPSPYVPVDNFTARFTTDAFFYAGNYNFSIVADDEVRLFVDGAIRLDTVGRGQSGKQQNVTISLTQGNHRVEVLYREWSVTAYVFVNWVYAGGGAVPPTQNWPPLPASATTVTTQFGNYTPCLQQRIHQSNCFVSDGAWDSPNLGSIQMEPQIESWVNCQPADQVATYFVSPQVPAKNFKCSKTLAGWFPN